MSANRPSEKDISEKFDNAIKELDEQRTEALKRLQELQAIKQRTLEKERERLRAKYGSDHPRVKKIAARLAYNEGIQKDLEYLIVRTDIDAREYDDASATGDLKPISPDMWIVQGSVTDEQGIGIGGLIVSLYDRDLLFDDVLGTTITDMSGNFRIMYRAEAFRDLFEDQPDLYLKVTDDQGIERYTSKETVRLEAGRVETFHVTIGRKPDSKEERDSRRDE